MAAAGDRQGHAAAVARAGARLRLRRRQLRERLQLRLPATYSWKSPTTPLPMESNPRAVFERLFGDGGIGRRSAPRSSSAGSQHPRLAMEDMARLRSALGVTRSRHGRRVPDRVRDVEQRIQRAEKQTGESAAADRRAAGRHPGGVRRARQADVRPASSPSRPTSPASARSRSRAS